jgi:phage baseplate assembly protein W
MELKSFLGTGWNFPPSFSERGKQVQLVSDQEDIEQSIKIILSTIPGERLMRPEFGCDINSFVFEKQDSAFENGINHIIGNALLNYEPRINFNDAIVLERNNLDGVIHIEISFTIIITNTRHNMVFPFYLLEGTNL